MNTTPNNNQMDPTFTSQEATQNPIYVLDDSKSVDSREHEKASIQQMSVHRSQQLQREPSNRTLTNQNEDDLLMKEESIMTSQRSVQRDVEKQEAEKNIL